MANYLENICRDIDYDDLHGWNTSDIHKFSNKKSLYPYQKEALENIVKVLYLAFANDNTSVATQKLVDLYREYGFDFNVSNNPINIATLWMATGSGKTIVLIKTIELLDFLMTSDLIPKKEIALFIPNDDLINQMKKEVNEFNIESHQKKIDLINLKDYDEDKRNLQLFDDIKVYYCKSGLLTDKHKVNELDYHNYLNNGNWYVFLDEAHRGTTDSSKFQKYVSELAENGFQFNFSATFTEELHYITTCYNFNLECFIKEGYGKNIWISDSMYTLSKKTTQLDDNEKTSQILKSMIMFALIKKSRNGNFYHNPMMVTYVNSVNTEEADLKLYFKVMSEIASNNNLENVFNSVKNELVIELSNNKKYEFETEKFEFDNSLLSNLSLEDLRTMVFNTSTSSKIKWQKGEAGKEIVLQLETSDTPFGLIRIGDVDTFSHDMLIGNYEEVVGYERKHYFKYLNDNDSKINMLVGSRTFYEGWDSNRPNVINLINIGSAEAKKFVPQAIGRGVRIQPDPDKFQNRKRLSSGDENKNLLLETLVVFATDKNSINSILDDIKRNKSSQKISTLSIKKNQNKFDLLIPVYKNKTSITTGKFAIGENDYNLYKSYIENTYESVLLLKHDLTIEKLNKIKEGANNKSSLFQNDTDKYQNITKIMRAISGYVEETDKTVASFKKLEEEILHFEKIAIDIENSPTPNANILDVDSIKIAKQMGFGYSEIELAELTNHYYCPLLYTTDEKIEYLQHIIKNKSEVDFVKNLITYINGKQSNSWMFSKIDETLDKLSIPYFDKIDNRFRDFYPDFIFWVKNNNDYDIYFVDPKGTEHTSYLHKVDYFKELFEENNVPKEFGYDNYKVKIHLLLVADNVNNVPEAYKKYWIEQNNFNFLEL